MRHWVLVTAAFLLLAARAQEATDATEATASCSVETVRQPWDPVEFPAGFYADQNCPSEDDAAQRLQDVAMILAKMVLPRII